MFVDHISIVSHSLFPEMMDNTGNVREGDLHFSSFLLESAYYFVFDNNALW